MSCRTTKGGTLALRLARHYSGLTDRQVQKLFHSLYREGRDLPEPGPDQIKMWQARQRALVRHAGMRPDQEDRSLNDLFLAQGEQPSGAMFHAWSRIELRARQEAVLQEITTAVDLDPPGSHADAYDYGADGRPTTVWYASYGSNLSRGRFMTYIEGGQAEGASGRQHGARDKTPPEEDIPIRFDGRMHFAHSSGRWGYGGVAFMDVDHAGHALGRAYRITSEQFDDVVAQENGRTPGAGSPVDLATVLDVKADTISAASLYGTVLHIGDYKGAPVLTFTGSFSAHDALHEAAASDVTSIGMSAANSPHGNYLRMITSGLQEAFGINEYQAADYLRGCGGAEDWSRRELLEVLRRDTPIPYPKPKPRPAGDYLSGSWTFGSGSSGSSATPTYHEDPLFSDPEPVHYGSTVGYRGTNRTMAGPVTVRYTKPCPICGKTGHTMHDCSMLRGASEDPSPAKPKGGRKRQPKKAPSGKTSRGGRRRKKASGTSRNDG